MGTWAKGKSVAADGTESLEDENRSGDGRRSVGGDGTARGCPALERQQGRGGALLETRTTGGEEAAGGDRVAILGAACKLKYHDSGKEKTCNRRVGALNMINKVEFSSLLRTTTIKRVCETELGLVSQCHLAKHVQESKAQYMENVALKINVKVGDRNTVLSDAPYKLVAVVSDKGLFGTEEAPSKAGPGSDYDSKDGFPPLEENFNHFTLEDSKESEEEDE
ncbi:uncharacterized protein A4U43_C02F9250 [Asparagus officinalis]|uniref:Piwi domain-containing protein n=1 Tax=Asparagus officinalis TaxID=4686 RepID=A0A5P1FHU8_ASPOF|nr:uncharacterized protein A4U43_C02F9250 [Asparagus officinalis]